MHPADRLAQRIAQTGSVACVGLDPRPALLPPSLRTAALARHGDTRAAVADAFLSFNRGLLEVLGDHCACIKPQLACYEAYGAEGLRCLEQTISEARARGIPVIADGKRNDIASTGLHYAQGWLTAAPGLDGHPLPGAGADWLTVNAYLGSDGITPFLEASAAAGTSAGIFVLVKTSNPSAGDLQDLVVDGASGETLAERMAVLVAQWGAAQLGSCGLSTVGAVVGATYPDQARRLRRLMPDTMFLVPGYGAQGASAADALAGVRADGSGLVVSSSRAVIAAWQSTAGGEHRWQDAARDALLRMNEELASVRLRR